MNDNKALGFKRTALRKVVEFFDAGKLETTAYRIPYDVIPQDAKSDVRCCIYKERAVFRERVLAALGSAVEMDDDIEGFAKTIWNSLNEDNKISLFVRCVHLSSGDEETYVINKYQ